MAGAVKDGPIAQFDVARDENLGLSENAVRVLKARYLKKNEAGEVVETPAEMFRRVARTVADVEVRYGAGPEERQAWEDRFFETIVSGRFMPNSPTLMNAGREMGMLSACFVLPVRDSIEAIFDTIKHTALIQKAGGGTGFAFDELRPTGDYIRSSGGTTSGPISFWRAFSEATNAIQQGAFRRGANMGMMYIHHPDILKFLHAKEDLTQFTNYNISVKVTDEWMEAFLRDPDGPHVVRNPRTGQEYVMPADLGIWTYDLRSLIPVRRAEDGSLRVMSKDAAGADKPLTVPVYTRRQIWDIIVRNAHRTGEPGVVFIDRINQHNPTPHIGRIEATNPCGEQPLLPYEACNLGSVNLGYFVTNPCTPAADVDWDGLRECVHVATRFLDNVIDANNYPLPQIEAMCKGNRKIGLGVMGFADALYKLGVRYSSEAGIAWGERLMRFINDEAHNCSEAVARERGCFPNWKGSIWDTRYNRPMRNAATTTVAPTGTISIIAGCSGGIEPLFSLAFFRNVLKGQESEKKPMVEINPIFEAVARQRGFYSEGLMDQIARDGTLAHIDGIPADVKDVFVCAHDITPEWHVRMQSAFQAHCDSSISKTINFPHDASVEDVDIIYRLAYALRCKGVTVYRDGCRSEQPMALKDSEKKKATASAPATQPAAPAQSAVTAQPAATVQPAPEPARLAAPAKPAEPKKPEPAREGIKMASDGSIEPRDIPEIVSGLRIRQMTPFGNMHVKITVDPRTGRELEVFAQLGKGGDLANSDLEAICRLISLWLRAGGSFKHVIQQLKDIGSSLQVPTKEGKIKSLGDGLARALMKYRRAKERFGLRDLLLGEYDLSTLDKDPTAPGNANGNGGNGKNGNGNGHGRTAEVRHGTAAHGSATVEGPAAGASAGLSLSSRVGFKVKCPSCGEGLVFAEGCNKCYSCGWAQC
ncbi:MAG TPA: vitamin B12-dependent ribonucleotide reductase [Phycisphaerae bacterium]|nr:vitamin B12-dependent ribonucleotide reductase [Phycisphaerae bacterium]